MIIFGRHKSKVDPGFSKGCFYMITGIFKSRTDMINIMCMNQSTMQHKLVHAHNHTSNHIETPF